MARVVILSFRDNAAAERFIHLKDKWESDDTSAEEAENELVALGAIVAASSTMEAVVAKPTLACQHNTGRGGYAQTKKFGWYVHAEPGCRRPHADVVRDFVKNMVVASGNNLLPDLREQWVKETAST